MEIFTRQEMQTIDATNDLRLAAEADMERANRHRFEVWGAKLKQLRDNRWYISFDPGCTWERYTKQRWEISSRHADRLIDAYEILDQIRPFGLNNRPNGLLPSRESHVRPLAKLEDSNQRVEVWQRVVDNSNGHITAAKVEAEVQRYIAALEKNWITLEEWNNGERWHGGTSGKAFNRTNENIEWAAWSWNPVTGCLHGCDYCYARDIANRFYPQGFEPTYHPDRLDAPINTKQIQPRWLDDTGHNGVFVCSMADLFGKWVPAEWIKSVLQSVSDNPQWEFLFLTKFPIRMAEFNYPPNVWLGTTVDKQWAVNRAEKAFGKIKASGFDGICWLSCEPMLERLTFSSLEMFDWVVMGGASRSSQTPEYKPPFDDINHLYNQARKDSLMVYQKTNLIPGMSDAQRVREYPIRRRVKEGE
jgi:protein gp37